MLTNNIHDSWKEFTTPDIKRELDNIENQIGTDYTPQKDKILRFLSLDLNTMKVVIVGQDPYKPVGIANGRSFQPSNLINWNDTFRQVSLKNIVRNIYAVYNGITEYRLIPSYTDIKYEINAGKFNIKQPQEWFDSLESQGVLFLNTTLTCKIGQSNSHKDIWRKFSTELINYIDTQRKDLIWFLWGTESKELGNIIKYGKIYSSKHPMMCSEKYEDDFLRNTCFKDTSSIINWLG